MIISCNTIVDRRDHVQYLTVSKSYSVNCTCSLTEQNTSGLGDWKNCFKDQKTWSIKHIRLAWHM